MIGTNFTSNNDHSLYFIPENNGAWNTSKALALKDNGSVFISDSLYVQGKIFTREVEVNLDQYPIPDYVFASDYRLLPLNELETFIKTNQHLPEVPSASEIKANGANLGEMNMVLLKKVEELSLYVIELKKEIAEINTKSDLNK